MDKDKIIKRLAERDSTPRYILRINQYQVFPLQHLTDMAWRTPMYGRPSAQNIEKWVETYNKSLEPGGANEHLGRKNAVYGGEIVDQMSGESVAEWSERAIIRHYKSKPMFEVVSNRRAGFMDRNDIAAELVEVAKMLSGFEGNRTAAANDLATILELIPAMEEKRAERVKKQEEYRQETNRMYNEEMQDIIERSDLLKEDLKKAIMGYFSKNGMGVSSSDWNNFGGEVFIGSGDGVKRSGSKVWVHLSIGIGDSLGHRDRDAYFVLRNETLDDQKFVLSEKNTVREVLYILAKFDKKGFWVESEIE